MDHQDGFVWLRPEGGGTEWTALPVDVQPLNVREWAETPRSAPRPRVGPGTVYRPPHHGEPRTAASGSAGIVTIKEATMATAVETGVRPWGAGRLAPYPTVVHRPHVSVTLDVARDLPSVETDASRVEQILVNLLTNAVRHTPDRSLVRVMVRAEKSRVVFEVTDEGPGVAEDDLERIFDVYVTRADEESRGVGLGLPLSRRLARLLGGELSGVATGGAGGQFFLSLPSTVRS